METNEALTSINPVVRIPLFLQVSREECSRRVMQRFGHRTLPPREASVMLGVARGWNGVYDHD